jgi:hypothetical protein
MNFSPEIVVMFCPFLHNKGRSIAIRTPLQPTFYLLRKYSNTPFGGGWRDKYVRTRKHGTTS